jgi:hypothetical protein
MMDNKKFVVVVVVAAVLVLIPYPNAHGTFAGWNATFSFLPNPNIHREVRRTDAIYLLLLLLLKAITEESISIRNEITRI